MSSSAFQGQQTSRQSSPFKRSRHQQLLQSPDMMRIRRRPDNDRRVPNDKRRPSKLAPTMRVLFTNERTNERTNDESDRATERPTNTMNDDDDDDETQRRLTYDRLRYEQVTTSTILAQLRTTDLECSYMLYTSLHGQQSHHMALYHRGKGASLWQWAVDCDMFSFLSCRQPSLPSLMRMM